MKDLIRPPKLQAGDKVATISLSAGAAGDYPFVYQQGKRQLEQTFGLTVVETRHALKPSEWLYKNPQARADDLMEAFTDPSVKAIISNIGGEDGIRVLPLIDSEIINTNSKIFLGFSDASIIHYACYKAGLGSFYGPSVMIGFAENGGVDPYITENIKRILFSADGIGEILPNTNGWTSEKIDWTDIHTIRQKEILSNGGWHFLQGSGKTTGKLLGGCVEVLEMLKSTAFWPDKSEWKGAILFLETSELMIDPKIFKWIIRNYVAQGIINDINGLILGRPFNNQFAKEYNDILTGIIRDELQLIDIPIITGMDFGHISPIFTIPIGRMAEIDCSQRTFSIIENAVSD